MGLEISSRLQGVLRSDKPSLSITVHDQGASALGSWDSRLCAGYRVNNGFHGIEMPRAHLLADFLEQCGCGSLLREIPNHRLLSVEGQEAAFNSSIDDWPQQLREGLPQLLVDYSQMQQPKKIIRKALSSTSIGKSISNNYHRFAADIEQCWHLFFPWFFPSDFTFQTEDEGASFQDKVRRKRVSPTYLIPRDLIFENLKAPIIQRLKSQHIGFTLGHALSRQDLEDISSSSSNKVIWCASSFGLLKALDGSLARKCISATRHMHIALYSVSAKAIRSLKERLKYLPTEVLYLDSEAPELNRLSFLDYPSAMSDKLSSSAIVMVEYFTGDRTPSEYVSGRIQACLEKQFSSPIVLEGQTYGRPMYILDRFLIHKASDLVENYASEKGIHIPLVYYGPINMAKCATVARAFRVEL